ncbi:MAG: hypothetical protein ACOVMI_03630 [Chitinophagaceae bacterium]
MEVHHHSHAHGAKNWKSYIWEFLMLFLAVLCGGLAEYYLEHKIEHDREKQYIKSLVADLKNDTSNIAATFKAFEMQQPYFDTVNLMMHTIQKGYNPSLMLALKKTLGYKDFVPTDKTLQQLKNAGNLRLISYTNVTDSIANYDLLIKKFNITSGDAQTQFLKVWEDYQTLIYTNYKDSAELKTKFLLSKTESDFKKYHNHIQNDLLLRGVYKRRLTELLVSNKNLLALIKKEYEIE